MSEAIAELLHTLMCDKMHNPDECQWYEEAGCLDEWEQPLHLEYLSMAENEMKISSMSQQQVLDVLNTITKLDFQKSMTRKLLERFLDIARRSDL